jgi:hypothetical protein
MRKGEPMNSKYKKITTATALLATLAIGQVYIAIGFAEPNSGSSVPAAASQQLVGILTTSNNRPISVNGANAINGATIPSGAVIETPDGVGATIRIGNLGSLCIAANSKVSIQFDRQGGITVTVIEGCAILRTSKGTSGIVNSAQGNIGQINASTGGSIDVCTRAGAAPTINQGAAVDAGAGASALDCGAAGAAAAPVGFPPAATVAFIGGGAAGLYLLFRGGNPSPSGL